VCLYVGVCVCVYMCLCMCVFLHCVWHVGAGCGKERRWRGGEEMDNAPLGPCKCEGGGGGKGGHMHWGGCTAAAVV